MPPTPILVADLAMAFKDTLKILNDLQRQRLDELTLDLPKATAADLEQRRRINEHISMCLTMLDRVDFKTVIGR